MAPARPPEMGLRIALLCHSIISDWNHGNAHFLRGLVRNLQKMGHQVIVFEEEANWSLSNLIALHGEGPIGEFRRQFPFIDHRSFVLDGRERMNEWVSELLDQVDVCIVHEWNPPRLVETIGRHASLKGVISLFLDTHHRALTEAERLPHLGLERYSGILAYGPTIAEIYKASVPGPGVFVFHEGADTDLFRPLEMEKRWDVLFVGNWGDDDRKETTRQYLIGGAAALPDATFALFGVRYPSDVLADIQSAGIEWGGWLPNYRAPEAYARSRTTLHIPRKEYVESLRGTPTIRVFEALACGVPLISAGWRDDSGLFEEGEDYLAVNSPSQMQEAVRWLANDEVARHRIGFHGLETVVRRHSCSVRARELLGIIHELALQ